MAGHRLKKQFFQLWIQGQKIGLLLISMCTERENIILFLTRPADESLGQMANLCPATGPKLDFDIFYVEKSLGMLF